MAHFLEAFSALNIYKHTVTHTLRSLEAFQKEKSQFLEVFPYSF